MNFKEIDIKPEYRSLSDNVVKDFYIPLLENAVLYERAVGFFSSSALVQISKGITGLRKNNGKMLLVASPYLSEEDVEAINKGYELRDIIENALVRELKEPKYSYEKDRLNLLANLVSEGVLDIKIAFTENEHKIGMYHEKMGIISDTEGNRVAFSGSMNESATAMTANYETIDVFCTWKGEQERVYSKEKAFESIWNNCEPNVCIINFPNLKQEIIDRYKRAAPNYDLDKQEFLEDKQLKEESAVYWIGPRIPSSINLREYQIKAIDEWKKQDYMGIFDMATGTGKTYTALAAIAELFTSVKKRLAVIIVCPFQHLVEQWKKDIEQFGMKPIVCYSSSSQKDWKSRLKTSVTGFNLGVNDHFCMVSTNATFSSQFVQDLIGSLKGNSVLVVDEAHNFGAENLSRTLLSNMKYRLALSATIDRHGDEEGTQKLYDYFGNKCIEYTLKEAIDNGMLTPYYYHPVLVTLNEEELAEYLEITRQIVATIHNKTDKNGKAKLSEYAKMLLIKRARLVAGASEKIIKLKKAISGYQNDSHILVYCGATTMHDVDYKEKQPPVDDIRQIDIVADLLGNELSMRVSKFTSEESIEERETLKMEFADGKHQQVLIAIRCLDEGVNIPSIKTAFILASSTNPKEYIQRRGRVLRTFKGKDFATIYDFITLPILFNEVSNYPSDVCDSVKSLAVREMIRMKDFASISENPSEVDKLISEIIEAYNITLDDERRSQDV